jgi:hypothetical protein
VSREHHEQDISNAWPRRLAFLEFLRGCCRRHCVGRCRSLLRKARAPGVGAAFLGFRPGMVRPLRSHWFCSLACLARKGFSGRGRPSCSVHCSACAKRFVDMAVFLLEAGRTGPRRHLDPLGPHSYHYHRFLAYPPDCRPPTGPLPLVGRLCLRT